MPICIRLRFMPILLQARRPKDSAACSPTRLGRNHRNRKLEDARGHPQDRDARREADAAGGMTDFVFRGLRASYQSWGQGLPLVLLHSSGSSGAQWAKVAEQLSTEHKLIAPDLLGFGATEAWPEPGGLTHDLQAELVAEVVRAESAAALDIVGHSYGGATAIRLLLAQPQLVRSLVLIEPIVSWLLNDANDPAYAESVRIARAFIESVDAGRADEGWEIFIDSRNEVGTWAHSRTRRRRASSCSRSRPRKASSPISTIERR